MRQKQKRLMVIHEPRARDLPSDFQLRSQIIVVVIK